MMEADTYNQQSSSTNSKAWRDLYTTAISHAFAIERCDSLPARLTSKPQSWLPQPSDTFSSSKSLRLALRTRAAARSPRAVQITALI